MATHILLDRATHPSKDGHLPCDNSHVENEKIKCRLFDDEGHKEIDQNGHEVQL